MSRFSEPRTTATDEGAGEGSLHPARLPRLHGHRAAEDSLLEAYRSERLHHAWLIGGPQGIGKATLAWHLARFLLTWPDPAAAEVRRATDLSMTSESPIAQRLAAGSHGDLVVLERRWNEKTKKLFSEIRVDDVRDGLGVFRRASGAGGYRICIIDSAEDLNRSSANALLKIIEEPPPRSIFLIVAHRPGQVMPTLLSRCRRLMLTGLPDAEVVAAVLALGGAGAQTEPARLQDAAARAQGSVGEAIRLLRGDTLDLDQAVQGLLRGLPDVDFRRVHRLADAVGMSDDLFALVLEAILDWLGSRVHERASGTSPHRLVRLVEAFDFVRAAAREASALNLDKRPVLLSIFADLARVTRTA